MLKGDFHSHTVFSRHPLHERFGMLDGIDTMDSMVGTAAKKGIDAIAITDHNVILNKKIAKEYTKKYNIVVIPGVEIHLNGKEFLAIGIQEYPKTTFEEIKDSVHEQDGILIACHPFDLLDRGRKDFENFDAIEVHNGYSKSDFEKVYPIAKGKNKAMVCGSDAHSVQQLGYTYCLVDADPDIDSIIAAIKKNDVEPIKKITPQKVFVEYYFRKYGKLEALRNKKYREAPLPISKGTETSIAIET